jgi:hypothetical protein
MNDEIEVWQIEAARRHAVAMHTSARPSRIAAGRGPFALAQFAGKLHPPRTRVVKRLGMWLTVMRVRKDQCAIRL